MNNQTSSPNHRLQFDYAPIKSGASTTTSVKDLTIEYDVITYQINQQIIKSRAVHHHPLVWDIPTPDQARLIFTRINIKGAQLSQNVECFYNDKAAQERRLSALADAGIMTCADLTTPTSNESSGVNQ